MQINVTSLESECRPEVYLVRVQSAADRAHLRERNASGAPKSRKGYLSRQESSVGVKGELLNRRMHLLLHWSMRFLSKEVLICSIAVTI